MEAFLANVFSFPTVIYSILLTVMLLYWLVAILGMVDLDVLDIDADMGDDLQGFAGLMVTLGLSGVPAPLALTILILYSWMACFLVVHYMFLWDLAGAWNLLIGSGVIVAAGAISIPLTARTIRPLKPLFKKAFSTPPHKALIGQTCTVRTGRVDEHFGEGTANVDGAGLILKIRNESGIEISHGEKVVLLEHRPEDNTYLVIPEREFKAD